MKTTLTAPPPLLAGDALFLDFDGTLAPLQRDPDTVMLPEGLDAVLAGLKAWLDGALAVMSGRDLEDLSRRVPVSLWRFGNHGLRRAGPGVSEYDPILPAPDALVQDVLGIIAPFAGARLEPKGPVLAVHYREVPEAGPVLEELLTSLVSAYAGYSLQSGKMVLEAKPKAANKGECLRRAAGQDPFAGRRPVMIGDDTTDEDAFAAALALGGTAIKVGEGETVAPFRLASPAAVHTYLQEALAG